MWDQEAVGPGSITHFASQVIEPFFSPKNLKLINSTALAVCVIIIIMSEVSRFCGKCGRPQFTGDLLWGQEQRHLEQPHETQLLALSFLVTASMKLKSFKGEPVPGSSCPVLNPEKANLQLSTV